MICFVIDGVALAEVVFLSFWRWSKKYIWALSQRALFQMVNLPQVVCSFWDPAETE